MARKRSRTKDIAKRAKQGRKTRPKAGPPEAVKTRTKTDQFREMDGVESVYFKKA